MLDKTGGSPLPHGLALVWGFPPPARRGPKPTYTVAESSTPRWHWRTRRAWPGSPSPGIARRLGLTPNALYRYIGSKDELVLLLMDAGTGPPPTDLPARTGVRVRGMGAAR